MKKEPKKSDVEMRQNVGVPLTLDENEHDVVPTTIPSVDNLPQNVLHDICCEVKELVRPNRGYLKLNYFTLFWIFVAGCVFGLVVETAFHAIVYRGLESRAGLVWGPFSPIYGVGAVLLTVFLNRFYHSHNLIIFTISMALGSCLEYITSWLMEHFWGAVAWDYTGTFGSIDGRTNFTFGVMWGLLGLLWVRINMPGIKHVFAHVNRKHTLVRIATIALSVFMAVDITITVLALNREGERANNIAATTWEQQFFDDNFPDSFLQSRMQNMSVYGKGA